MFNDFFYNGGTSPTKFIGRYIGKLRVGPPNTMVESVEILEGTSELATITMVEMVEMFFDNKSHLPTENALGFLFWDEFVILVWICYTWLLDELSFHA